MNLDIFKLYQIKIVLQNSILLEKIIKHYQINIGKRNIAFLFFCVEIIENNKNMFFRF